MVSVNEKLLKGREATLGPEHPDTIRALFNLAVSYKETGAYEKAAARFEQVIPTLEAHAQPDVPDLPKFSYLVDDCYIRLGQPQKSVPLFERALKQARFHYGPGDPMTYSMLNNLGTAYWRHKQLDKSIPLFEGAVKGQAAQSGRDHPETIRTIGNLGVNYKDAGRFPEAVPLLEEAYRASAKYPQLRGIGTPLLDAYVGLGKAQQAAALVQELLAEVRKMLPKDSPQLAGQLASLGLLLLQVKAFNEAEPLIRECLAIREKTQPEAWTTFNTKSLLGGALLGQKKYAEAEPLLLKGCEGMQQRGATIPQQGKIRLTEALERVIKLYEAIDKKDDATKWRKELDATRAAQKKLQKQP
jgi:tetratricopeptide (TPR) repeat protein